MREILYRGKLVQNGAWVYGYYCKMGETTYAFEEDYQKYPVKTFHMIAQESMTDSGLPNKLRLYEIDPETVGQYTGKNDRNAKKIFEGDILRNDSTGEIVSVWWDEDHCCFVCRGGEVSPVQVGSVSYQSTIIGNVHENPEILEQKGDKT